MARIALDAMGGDFAPQATVAGALLALAELDPAHTHPARRPHRRRRGAARARSSTASSSALAAHRDRIDDRRGARRHRDDRQAQRRACAASRTARWPSASRLQADGQSDAFVSAGNTGAQMAASDGAAQAARRPHAAGHRHALPDGAQAGRRARLRRQRRLLAPRSWCSSRGSAPSTPRTCSGATNPAVGLLSIGEEPEKGNAVVKEAHQLLAASGLNFMGNVEGRDLPPARSERGPIDVVVCDGFVGNVVLKFYEAIAPMHDRHARARRGVERRAARAARSSTSTTPSTAARRCSASGRQHHLARQVVAARDQERDQGRRAGGRVSGMNEHIGARLAAAAHGERRVKRPVAYVAGTGTRRSRRR